MGRTNRPDTLVTELTTLKKRVAQLETQQRLSSARISTGQLNVGAVGAAGQIEIDATDEEIRIYNAGVLIAALTAAQGLYLSGYEDAEAANGIVLQPKNTATSDFAPATLFTKTVTATGENQTWLSSPYDQTIGENAAGILLRGSDAAQGDTSMMYLSAAKILIGGGGSTDLLGPWTAYTPTWTGSTTNPTIGNGSLTGRYMLIGKTCHVSITLQTGSTSTYGTGTYQLGLPFAAAVGPGFLGTARLTITSGSVYIGQVTLSSGNSIVNPTFPSQSTPGTAANWTQTAPVGLTSGTTLAGLTLSLTYQTA